MTTGLRRALGPALTVVVVLAAAGAAAASPPRTPSLASVVIANVGPGYGVLSQGPLNPEQFASSSPDPSAAAGALHTLSGSITSYQRVWQDAAMDNEVQDLVVRFNSTASAMAFEKAAQHALSSGEIVSRGPAPSIPGALRTSYFATTASQVGVGQAITLRRGAYVILLSMFSANSPANTTPISSADALTVAQAQYAAVGQALTVPPHRATVPKVHRSLAGEVLAAVAVICLFALWSRRTRPRPSDPAARGPLEADDPAAS